MTTCWLDRYEGRWGATVKLPANPEVQSRMVYDFESGPEALEYCHSVACHLVDVCESLEAEPKLRSYLDTIFKLQRNIFRVTGLPSVGQYGLTTNQP